MTIIDLNQTDGEAPILHLGDFKALDELLSTDALDEREWRPIVIKLEPGEHDEFSMICDRNGILEVDEYARQLLDLAHVRMPDSTLTARKGFADEYVTSQGGHYSSGNWIVLPWARKVVHLLEEDPYFEVITSRNHDKITHLEQQILRSKTIGVMGLSLGGEAAVAVAQEHLCGHIVLADFDHLDLSNLNRLNAGFDDLALPKTTIAARRIVKINPYLRVSIFEEGVTKDNADSFLEGLDLLIEECDGLAEKFHVRTIARERGLNIVFAGDERGFLSVEPYGQGDPLPLFHGRVGTPSGGDQSSTPRARLEELTKWLGGWEALSARTRYSLEQVGVTLCGYPQLASEARYAAGQVGHIARRLLLGERVLPFLGHVDLEEHVPSTREN